MKKNYISPSLTVTAIAASLPVATSPAVTVNSEDASAIDAGDVQVKRNDYNVWNDDWSR